MNGLTPPYDARPTPGGQFVSERDVTWFAGEFERITANVATVLRGKDAQIRLALTTLCAEGHLLIEDVPGVGKTSLARALASSFAGRWARVQFTPDLLPSDVTGVSIWNAATRQFEFQPGPVFANVVVGDEINRASPKTQSSLLEVMEERQVTVDGTPRPVPTPFLVVATQNPIEMEGTYNLPEAQLDRFLVKLTMGYPDPASEADLVVRRHGRSTLDPPAVTDVGALTRMVELTRAVHVAPELVDYAVGIVTATRNHVDFRLGASPRGSIGLVRAAQAVAASNARQFVTPDDVRQLTVPVLAHRCLLSPDAQLRGVSTESVLTRLAQEVRAPNGALV